MASIHCSARSCPQRTALKTSFMLQVVKAYIHEPRAELQEGSEMGLDQWSRTNDGDDGDGGERIDSHGGHEQGTVVEIPCKRQSAGSVAAVTLLG